MAETTIKLAPTRTLFDSAVMQKLEDRREAILNGSGVRITDAKELFVKSAPKRAPVPVGVR